LRKSSADVAVKETTGRKEVLRKGFQKLS